MVLPSILQFIILMDDATQRAVTVELMQMMVTWRYILLMHNPKLEATAPHSVRGARDSALCTHVCAGALLLGSLPHSPTSAECRKHLKDN